MRKKQLINHLHLNKVTVAHLDRRELGRAKGGCTTQTIETCEDCKTTFYDGWHKPSDNTCFTEPPGDTATYIVD